MLLTEEVVRVFLMRTWKRNFYFDQLGLVPSFNFAVDRREVVIN